jgi:ferrous iron transport protein B
MPRLQAAPGTPSDVLLVGQPNVGKSVLFSRLTGVRTIASNYPGTTVGFTSGRLRYGGANYHVVDAPGTYSLEPLDEASRVTVELLRGALRIVNVVDATHLERHLPLTLELIAQDKPLAVALNMSDEARHLGIAVDSARLAARLGVPVIPVVARSGEGVKRLVETALSLPAGEPNGARAGVVHAERDPIWRRVGALVGEVQTIVHHHHSFGQRLEEWSIHPLWGSLVALVVLAASFSLVRLIGEFLIGGSVGIVGAPWLQVSFGTELLFERGLGPPLALLSGRLGPGSFLHRLLIGSLVDGRISFEQSFGLLTSGLFIPLGIVLPYLLSFYLVLALLEDSGYLPRLAVFLDNIMHRFGLHGYAIIPTLLGLGCNVPGILATRVLETRWQRFVTATLISIAVPCAALQAMILGILGSRGPGPVVLVYATLFVVWVLVSLVLRFSSRGFRPELLLEIPPYRLPSARALVTKMWIRISGFLREAVPIMLAAVLAVNLLYELKVFGKLARIASPLVTRLWGLPAESIVPLVVGILRKDLALGLFIPLHLSTGQLVISSVLLTMFFPCLATCVVLFQELGFWGGLKSLGVMLAAVVTTGTLLNLML